MKPTEKSPELENVIHSTFGFSRTDNIKANRCVPKPIGCGKIIDPDTEFTDATSIREYKISGLCNDCQRKIFG